MYPGEGIRVVKFHILHFLEKGNIYGIVNKEYM